MATEKTNAGPNASPSTGEYVVVARRYRPQSFEDLVGQGMVSQALKNAINTERVGHAYLFTGARGVGKTSTARILAKALNCIEGPTETPCNHCDICEQIASGEDVDVLEIDGASNRGIDEIRQLRSNVGIRPSRSRFKVYIIDEVHMLTKEAFNALLKTLEEPPDHVKFMFCTTEPGKIPITVLSRCQRFDFSPVEASEIAERLRFIVEAEGASAEPEALDLLSRRAAGSMRDSQSLLEQLLSFVGKEITVDDVHSMFGTAKSDRVNALVASLIARDAGKALTELDVTLNQGVDSGQLAEQLVTSLRDILASAVGCDPNLFLFHSPTEAEQLSKFADEWGVESLLAAIQILDQSVTRMRQSVHGRILLEVALVRIAKLENLDELSSVVAQIGSAGAVSVQAGRPSAASPKKKAELGVTTARLDAAESQQPSTPAVSAPTLPAESTSGSSTSGSSTIQAAAPIRELHESDAKMIASTEKSEGVSEPSSSEPSSSAPIANESGSDEQTTSVSNEEPVEIAGTPESASETPLNEESAQRIWRQALDSMGDMTADFASHASRIAISAPNRLAIGFLDRYNSSKTYCERPERREKIEAALSSIVGSKVKIEFSTLRVDAEQVAPQAPAARPAVNSQQLRREIVSHPLVDFAVKLFDGQVMKVEPGGK